MSGNFKSRKFDTRILKGYTGKQAVITTRSSWETKIVALLQQLSIAKAIKGWNSEEAVFEYAKSIDGGLPHRYFMDFCIFKNDGQVVFIEVKPMKETVPPYPTKNMTAKQKVAYEKASHTYMTNNDKWSAVVDWCKENSNNAQGVRYSFQIWTEELKRPGQQRFYDNNKRNMNFPVFPVIPVNG